MFIREIELERILGCHHVKMNFDVMHPVYIVLSTHGCPAKTMLSDAVRLICSAKYISSSSLEEFRNIHEGYVRLEFLMLNKPVSEQGNFDYGDYYDAMLDELSLEPSTSEAARERELRRCQQQLAAMSRDETANKFMKVSVIRDFRVDPDYVIYCVDNGQRRRCKLAEFHGQFMLNVEYISPGIAHSVDSNEWLRTISTELNSRWNFDSEGGIFEKFANLFIGHNLSPRHFLSKLTSTILTSLRLQNILKATQFASILNDTCNFFEYFTGGEYTVWFLVPCGNEYLDLIQLKFTSRDLRYTDVITSIQKKNDSQRRLYNWNNADHSLQDLLIIAFQISLAYHSQQKILYLQNLHTLYDFQLLQYARMLATLLLNNSTYQAKWTDVNYIQRIINACNRIGVTVIMELPGGIPEPFDCANHIKCYEVGLTRLWSLKIVHEFHATETNQITAPAEIVEVYDSDD